MSDFVLKTLYWDELDREQRRKIIHAFEGTSHWDYIHHGFLPDENGRLRYVDWIQGPDFGKLKYLAE